MTTQLDCRLKLPNSNNNLNKGQVGSRAYTGTCYILHCTRLVCKGCSAASAAPGLIPLVPATLNMCSIANVCAQGTRRRALSESVFDSNISSAPAAASKPACRDYPQPNLNLNLPIDF